jgi:hypothetical protein
LQNGDFVIVSVILKPSAITGPRHDATLITVSDGMTLGQTWSERKQAQCLA